MIIKSIAATLALTGLSISVAQADQWSDIESKGKFICGVFSDVPPFSSPDPKTRELVGMDTDLCKGLADKLGVPVELKPLSVEARIPELRQGRVDVVIANLAYTKTRAEQIQFSDPYYIARERLVVKAPLAKKSKAYFSGKKLSSTKGSTSEQSIRLAGAKPVTFQDTGSAYLAVLQNKSLGVVTNGMTARSLIRSAKDSGVELAMIDEAMALEPVGVGMRQGEAAFYGKVNTALMAMENDGTIDSIWDKWIGVDTVYGIKRVDKVQKIADLDFEPLN
ncbi:ABC transporter substrate-binding protein [Marinomonas transparens]|uniref:ABC transporter substrate-binding protein n=1 Tax=Marinomonas transparens TaxID=2795388 RepID=A0A934JUM8_9GAMM|nr:ABC transporter substrate-binding protein [Marinomonas transparens]MBJ7538607.1 ABC transporter substrate-binding protein [Marinomonas transparens]